MSPEIAAVMSGPRKITLLRDGNSAFVEIEPLRLFPINRRSADGSHYVGKKSLPLQAKEEPAPRACPDCGKSLTAKNKSGYCAPHLLAHRNASPEQKAAVAAARQRYLAIPGNREALGDAIRKGMENLSPAERARRSEQGKRMVPTLQSAEVQAKANQPEVKAASARKRTATMIHWCPPELIPTYRALSKKLASAQDAREAMLPLIAGTAENARRTVLNHQDAQRIRHARDVAQSY